MIFRVSKIRWLPLVEEQTILFAAFCRRAQERLQNASSVATGVDTTENKPEELCDESRRAAYLLEPFKNGSLPLTRVVFASVRAEPCVRGALFRVMAAKGERRLEQEEPR